MIHRIETELATHQNLTDVILVCDRVGFSAHRFVLAATSALLARVLGTDYAAKETNEHAAAAAAATPRSNSETSLVRYDCKILRMSFMNAP